MIRASFFASVAPALLARVDSIDSASRSSDISAPVLAETKSSEVCAMRRLIVASATVCALLPSAAIAKTDADPIQHPPRKGVGHRVGDHERVDDRRVVAVAQVKLVAQFWSQHGNYLAIDEVDGGLSQQESHQEDEAGSRENRAESGGRFRLGIGNVMAIELDHIAAFLAELIE